MSGSAAKTPPPKAHPSNVSTRNRSSGFEETEAPDSATMIPENPAMPMKNSIREESGFNRGPFRCLTDWLLSSAARRWARYADKG
jgi:hypothetical protein